MKNRIEMEDGGEDGERRPNLDRFREDKDKDAEAAKAEERRARERERMRRRRARAKGKAEDETVPIDPDTCHFVNVFLVHLIGTVARRDVNPTAEQYATLDACLAKIGEKYGGWLMQYATEATYAVTLFAVVVSAPKIEPAEGEPVDVRGMVPDASPQE